MKAAFVCGADSVDVIVIYRIADSFAVHTPRDRWRRFVIFYIVWLSVFFGRL